MAKLLLIDNYDSFTYNLVQAFAVLGARVEVQRNDAIGVNDVLATGLTHLVISPGPGRPADAGISMAAIERCAGKVPVLGVCLGHQSIVEVFGGRVDSASTIMHGKSSAVHHDGKGVFAGLDQPLEAGRYHSLAAVELPGVLEVSARTDDEEVMAVRHRELCIEGVQFHPESVLTPQGDRLLENFLKMEIT
ncbi:MAG: aminodeoxychorismate/anthranilate synthase component II [Gammaproteobacteria bacterium]|nr:aminodeoxychorismate/anthranilate synthase component II [Gammaproteobacteria bacterium]NNF60168.1 aminodeoxychorismate/anthranilate synthase component II [Gammaproteobacteria bacterium]NNM21581.1 aminodeoxychorismate/anthranilate synthase component II [Gammaproteobacteria bacterium]